MELFHLTIGFFLTTALTTRCHLLTRLACRRRPIWLRNIWKTPLIAATFPLSTFERIAGQRFKPPVSKKVREAMRRANRLARFRWSDERNRRVDGKVHCLRRIFSLINVSIDVVHILSIISREHLITKNDYSTTVILATRITIANYFIDPIKEASEPKPTVILQITKTIDSKQEAPKDGNQ